MKYKLKERRLLPHFSSLNISLECVHKVSPFPLFLLVHFCTEQTIVESLIWNENLEHECFSFFHCYSQQCICACSERMYLTKNHDHQSWLLCPFSWSQYTHLWICITFYTVCAVTYVRIIRLTGRHVKNNVAGLQLCTKKELYTVFLSKCFQGWPKLLNHLMMHSRMQTIQKRHTHTQVYRQKWDVYSCSIRTTPYNKKACMKE